MAYYELVNTASGNLVGDYDTEAEALEDVRLTSERFGAAALNAIALGYQDDAGHIKLIAEGPQLLALIRPPAIA